MRPAPPVGAGGRRATLGAAPGSNAGSMTAAAASSSTRRAARRCAAAAAAATRPRRAASGCGSAARRPAAEWFGAPGSTSTGPPIRPTRGTVARTPNCQRDSGPSFQYTGSQVSGSIGSHVPVAGVLEDPPQRARRRGTTRDATAVRRSTRKRSFSSKLVISPASYAREDRPHVGNDGGDLRAFRELVGDQREQRGRARGHEVLEEVAHVELVDLRALHPDELERLHVDVGADVGVGVDVDPTLDVRRARSPG